MLALFFNEVSPTIPALERAFCRMTSAMGLPWGTADIPVKFRSAVKEIEGSVLAIQDRKVRFSNPGVRDFLQRVIEEDRFLPIAVGAVTEFAEVNRTWRFFCDQKAYPPLFDKEQGVWIYSVAKKPKTPEDPSSAAWVGAAGRLLKDGSGSALQRLHLLINMYNDMYRCPEKEELLQLVSASIRELQNSEIEGIEADLCRETFEEIHSSLLPLDVQDDANRVLSAAVVVMLTDYGDSLNLDELESVLNALFEFGVDKNAAAAVANTALEGHINNLPEMKELDSLDELKRHEKRLKTFMNDYGFLNDQVVSRMEISIRRLEERLIERDEEEKEGFYSGGWGDTSTGQISSAQIRSIFSQLSVRCE